MIMHMRITVPPSPPLPSPPLLPPSQSTLQAVTNTQNVDDPENGLEGLAQVVACEDIIGWRARNATGRERGRTRIVLFLTDAHFHYSGEGIVRFSVPIYTYTSVVKQLSQPP